MNRKTSLVKAVAVLSMAGLTAAPGLSQAAGGMDFYAGADVVQLTSETSAFGSSSDFTTLHLRLKGGMNIINWLAVEAQLVSDADDTDNAIGFKHSTGFILGIFAKPHVTVGPVDLYGLLGYATAEASLECDPACGAPKAKATLDGVAYGLGAQYLVTKQLKVSLDYMVYHDDSATYDGGIYVIMVDTKTSGIGLGVNYTF
jgi:opacity protein-like surface antigen